MDANGASSEPQRELNDSGCVQDESPPKKPKDSYVGQAELLDLSDDVLLCILKYCTPHELKALGFTCPRLGSLVLERSLWTSVDARATPSGIKRMSWLLQAVHNGTKELQLCGLARDAAGCLGHVNRKEESAQSCCGGDNNNTNTLPGVDEATGVILPRPPSRRHLFRMSTPPSWLDEECEEAPAEPTGPQEPGQQCTGPQFTVTAPALRMLKEKCPKLTSLSLDYCNINCRKTTINQFPATLKRLSLKGTKCYNLPLDTSFLFKIHDTLKLLEYLDVSECEWLEPAALLPLSKLPALTSLLVRDCPAMSEFVAYVSLATRYGFRKLKLMDFSGSPVGDPEVSALGWLPALQSLRLAAPAHVPRTTHTHYRGDCVRPHQNCERWEMEEPEYYKSREGLEASSPESSVEDVQEQVERMRERFAPHDQICIEVHTRPHEVRTNLNSREAPHGFPRSLDHQPRPSNEDRPNRPPSDPPRLSYDPLWPLNPRSDPNPLKRKADTEESGTQAGPSQKKKVESPNESPEKDRKVKDEKLDSAKNESPKSETKNESPKSETQHGSPKSETQHESPKSDSKNESPTKRKKLSKTKIQNPFENDIRKLINKPERSQNETLKSESLSENSSSNGSNESPVNDSPSTSRSAKNDSPANDNEKPGPSYRDNSSNTENLDCHSFEINYPSSSSYSVNININKRPKIKEQKRRRSAQPQDIPSPGPSRRSGTFEQFVHFRQNQEPVVVQCPRHQDREQGEPRHHVLYVNLGQQLHAVYRLLPNRPVFRTVDSRDFRPPSADRLDGSSLVTDSAVFRFGRAQNDHVNYVNIGPNGPQIGGRADGGRPNTSNLRELVATGYRGITNRSLVHLTSAAPHLRYIDFTNTGVTAEGVETFRSLRPDCEITYSEYVTSWNELEETDE